MSTNGLCVELIANLVAIGVNLTANQRAYLAWRTSDEGKNYFRRTAENEFYNALAKGDTSVIDVGIKEKQDMINRLKRELGLLALLVAVLISGCASIPPPLPLTVNALKTTERTYTVQNVPVVTDQGREILAGSWHIVSSDFMKDHVRNQDDLIASLESLKKAKRKGDAYADAAGALGLLIVCVIVVVLIIVGVIKRGDALCRKQQE